MDPVQELKNVLSTSNKVVAFLGAGTSSDSGVLTWPKALDDMNKKFNSKHPLIDTITVDEYIKKYGYPKTASYIYSVIADHEIYLKFMKNSFIPRGTLHHGVHSRVINIFKKIITTNYDDCIEDCCDANNKEIEIQYLPNFSLSKFYDTDHINLLHIHGSINSNEFIFTYEEYEKHYKKTGNENYTHTLGATIKDIIENNTLVFLGFSFDDPFFKEFFRDFISKNDNTNHYIFIQRKSTLPGLTFEEISKEKIRPVDLLSKKLIIDNGTYFSFKDDFEEILKNSDFDSEIKAKIVFLNEKLNDRIEKLNFFEKNKIRIIKFDEYIDIQKILKEITPSKLISNNTNNFNNAGKVNN